MCNLFNAASLSDFFLNSLTLISFDKAISVRKSRHVVCRTSRLKMKQSHEQYQSGICETDT